VWDAGEDNALSWSQAENQWRRIDAYWLHDGLEEVEFVNGESDQTTWIACWRKRSNRPSPHFVRFFHIWKIHFWDSGGGLQEFNEFPGSPIFLPIFVNA
jgi:hypothetical protein